MATDGLFDNMPEGMILSELAKIKVREIWIDRQKFYSYCIQSKQQKGTWLSKKIFSNQSLEIQTSH